MEFKVSQTYHTQHANIGKKYNQHVWCRSTIYSYF